MMPPTTTFFSSVSKMNYSITIWPKFQRNLSTRPNIIILIIINVIVKYKYYREQFITISDVKFLKYQVNIKLHINWIWKPNTKSLKICKIFKLKEIINFFKLLLSWPGIGFRPPPLKFEELPYLERLYWIYNVKFS